MSQNTGLSLSPFLRQMLSKYRPASVESVLPALDLDLLYVSSNNSMDFLYLGHHFQARFAHEGNRTDIDQSIAVYEHALSLLLDDRSADLQRLREHGLSMIQGRGDQAAAVPDAESSLLLPCLHRLGQSLGTRFTRYGEAEDLDTSITVCLAAFALTPAYDEDRFSLLDRLALSYDHRLDVHGDVTDLHTAIDLAERANLLIPEDSVHKPRALNTLGKLYATRYTRLNDEADLAACISHHELADALTSDGHAEKSQFLSDYGRALCLGFHEGRRNRATLEKAISVQRRGIELLRQPHMNEHLWLLSLSESLLTHYHAYHELSPLDEAIKVLHRVLRRTPRDQSGARAACFEKLGLAYYHRHGQCGEASDLEEAIRVLTSACALMPDTAPSKCHVLQSLAQCHMCAMPPDLDRAVPLLERAIAITANSPDDRLIVNQGYAEALRLRYKVRGNVLDLQKAISVLEEIVEATPLDHIGRPSRLSALMLTLEFQLRFTRTSPPSPSEWDRLITVGKEIVEGTRDGNPMKAKSLYHLGNYYMQKWFCSAVPLQHPIPDHPQITEQFTSSADNVSLAEAITSFRAAATSTSGSPSVRFHAAFSWAHLSNLHGSTREGFEAYKAALDTLPLIAWLGGNIDRRYDRLAEFPDAGREAALTAIGEGEFASAVEWLEQSRSVVWGQMYDLRTSVDDVRAVDPALAERMVSVGQALDKYGVDTTSSAQSSAIPLHSSLSNTEDAVQDHHRLAEEWDALVAKARSFPRLGGFLMPKKLQDLALAARDGPVVLVNVYGLHCDALIITKDLPSKGVIHVPLKDFSMEFAQKLYARFHQCLVAGNVRARDGRGTSVGHTYGTGSVFSNLLGILWKRIVKPVLNALDLQVCAETDMPPRLWWCPTGPLAFLPLHAAGLYNQNQRGHKVFEYVVSSYTPTLTILCEHARAAEQSNSDFKGLLMVSQPSTPGQNSIPKTRDEVGRIVHVASMSSLSLDAEWMDGDEATVEAVLESMASYSWVHLACHAVQNASKPTLSAFMLENGALPLTKLIKAPLPSAEFAFLSACQTASGDAKLAEEAVHLASGMSMAGYRSIIATMWSIRDSDGPVVAEAVYSQLLGGEGIDRSGSAVALHRAVSSLRDRVGEEDFLSWVPFIHVGL